MKDHNQNIIVSKARVHNLKSINVTIPRGQFTVITGPSGSGKSSLAFDTIYIEGQRRYIESLSSYARQFIGVYSAPDVESITGLSPSLAIDQKTTSRNPRSTVGTITEIYDYLRVLYARVGTLYCPTCQEIVQGQSPQKIVHTILKYPEQTKLMIMAPIVRGRKGEHKELLAKYMALGFSRVRIDGTIHTISDEIKIHKSKNHTIEIIVDRIVIRASEKKRLFDSIELSLKMGEGTTLVRINDQDELSFSEHNTCSQCQKHFPELEPRLFSFNSPIGACTECNGLGETKDFHPKLLITDPSISILDGAIGVIYKKNSFLLHMVKSIAQAEKVKITVPFNILPDHFLDILFNGSEKEYAYSFESENSHFHFKKAFPGLGSWLYKKYMETSSERTKNSLEEFMSIQICKSCKGAKLNPYARATKINGLAIYDTCELSITKALDFFQHLSLQKEKAVIAEKLLKEIKSRLTFLINVGLDYLTLNRNATTLSGGEAQRIRLATQIGSALSGVLYVLDEPSIGLHPRDNQKLIQTIISLKELGNTVLVVEHDEEMILSADHIIDMGPGAGSRGGEIVAVGTPAQIKKNPQSLTGRYLSGKEAIALPINTRPIQKYAKLTGATQNNLKNVDITFPLFCFTCITGVSGSGKSTLIHDVLVPAVKDQITKQKNSTKINSNYSSLIGADSITQVIELDQSPIGRTPKSNPATYTGLFDEIRAIYAQVPEAKMRGYGPGRFSFNVKGGRCEECEGNGVIKVEMHFLPDVYIECSSCRGERYNEETLSILYKGKNITELLRMNVDAAYDFFQHYAKCERILRTMKSVGLGYLQLGQPATTLSGGEAQRLKLCRELSKRTSGHCLYILDEPTTGLHFQDINILLEALHLLVDQGHTVYIIEHNLDVIKTADYIIDLGPEGGDKGGQIVVAGVPKEIVSHKTSHTAFFLKNYF